ncbi:hypothetical protein [Lederbergia galactosidilytica]|uniref:Uncharacterized protein n=1 Tax=Lederbergia galactosidilytica TaxID=217031 RepID=A0A0Q9XXI0_9BACI|nr:hypothetical protein [Lederbergia galactosidilytica]KRG13270.1 hypothetical protein ACA29_09090 [Lederbergia galactosidilytica]OAK68172.1 hypothetical protein ABB05_16560 [Lederbergia galactosidilytica]
MEMVLINFNNLSIPFPIVDHMDVLIAILPLLIMVVAFIVVIGLVVWFAVTVLKKQKENNILLKKILKKLDSSYEKVE